MTQKELAQMIDVTLVKNTNTKAEIDRMIDYVGKYPFACVFTLQGYFDYVKKQLKENRTTHVGGIMGFPSGGAFTELKLMETRMNVERGADELDMVVNLGWLLSGMYDEVLNEIRQIRALCPGIPLKCIVELPCLDDDTAKKACELVALAGADYVKTGTGWFGPATIEQVRLIRSVVGKDLLIKAAGGIRTLEEIEAFKAEGVHRVGIGLASAIEILEGVSSDGRSDSVEPIVIDSY